MGVRARVRWTSISERGFFRKVAQDSVCHYVDVADCQFFSYLLSLRASERRAGLKREEARADTMQGHVHNRRTRATNALIN